MSFWSLLRRMRVVDPFDPVEVDRAETENAVRDHSSVMARIDATVGEGVRQAQQKLRASIEHSKSMSQTASREGPDMLAQLLRDMKSSPGRDLHRGH